MFTELNLAVFEHVVDTLEKKKPERGSTGYKTCKVTATAKSQAHWYGSQRAHSITVAALSQSAYMLFG